MASFSKFNDFVEQLCKGVHDFSTHTFKCALFTSGVDAADATYSDISATEVANGYGYTTGGETLSVSVSETSGTVKVSVTADKTWTASEGSISNIRYAVIYNDSATNKNLVCYWDYGSQVTLSDGESFTVDFDQTNGIFTIT